MEPSQPEGASVDNMTVEAPPKDSNQVLTKFYKTQPNDSMLKIAYLINMNVTHLKRINDLLSDELYPGQIIKVIIPLDADILKNP
jgi:LysM repeat protein